MAQKVFYLFQMNLVSSQAELVPLRLISSLFKNKNNHFRSTVVHPCGSQSKFSYAHEKKFPIEFIVVFHIGCLEDLRKGFELERFCQKAGLIKRPKKTAVVS